MRKYTVGVTALSVNAEVDLIAITAASTCAVCVTRAAITQGGNVTSEQNLAVISRASTNNTTGATALTPRPFEVGDPVAASTVYSVPNVLNTLTGNPLEHEGFNWVSGYLWVPAPEERIWIPPSGVLVLRLANAPSAAKTVDALINFIELG